MRAIKRHLWIGVLALGLLFVGIGALFMVTALEAKGMIRDALAEENATMSKDSVKFEVPAGVLVTDAGTAKAQSEVIKMHSIERYGLYFEMERDDPNRATYIKGLTLRNSLNMAVMGFGVADLAMGMGAIIILMGVGTMAFLAPVVYIATNEEDELPEVNAGARAAPPAPAV